MPQLGQPFYADSTDPSYQPLVPPVAPAVPAPVSQVPAAQAQVPVPPAPAPAPPAYVGTPAGAIQSTPQQSTADALNVYDAKQRITAEQGNVDLEGNKAVAAKLQEKADLQKAQAADFATHLETSRKNIDAMSQQAQSAYNDYRQAAINSGKDPSEQFWAVKGTDAKIIGLFGAFASGFGASLAHQGGNPFMDNLNKQIEMNYQANRAHVDDLYKAQVEAGHLVDTAQNRALFDQKAQLAYYELASQHLEPELQAIKANTTGQSQKLLADQSIQDLQLNKVKAREELAALEAKQGAAASALQRAQQKEMRDAFTKAYTDSLTAGASEDDARIAASKFVAGLGYNRSQLAPILGANGVKWNPGTDSFVFPKSTTPPSAVSEPTVDENGHIIVPTVDANGHRIKPEEQQRMKDELSKRLVNDVDTGKPRLVTNEKSLQSYTEHAQAYPEAMRLTAQLKDAWAKGDEGRYHQAREALIELAPKLYGYTRGPSGAQAGEGGGSKDGQEASYNATVAGQLPETIPMTLRVAPGVQNLPHTSFSDVGKAKALLQGWDDHLAGIHKSVTDSTFGGSPQSPAATPVSKDDLGFKAK